MTIMNRAIDNDMLTPAACADLSPRFAGQPLAASTVVGWIRNGINGRKLPACKIGKRYAIRKSDWQAFLDSMQSVIETR